MNMNVTHLSTLTLVSSQWHAWTCFIVSIKPFPWFFFFYKEIILLTQEKTKGRLTASFWKNITVGRTYFKIVPFVQVESCDKPLSDRGRSRKNPAPKDSQRDICLKHHQPDPARIELKGLSKNDSGRPRITYRPWHVLVYWRRVKRWDFNDLE